MHNSGLNKASGTLRFLGCCRCSRLCFLCSSLCRRPLYSSWFSSSVWCCSRMSSTRSFCSICSCRRSRSWVDSSCRIIRACSISFWVLFLFSSWDKKFDISPYLIQSFINNAGIRLLYLLYGENLSYFLASCDDYFYTPMLMTHCFTF